MPDLLQSIQNHPLDALIVAWLIWGLYKRYKFMGLIAFFLTCSIASLFTDAEYVFSTIISFAGLYVTFKIFAFFIGGGGISSSNYPSITRTGTNEPHSMSGPDFHEGNLSPYAREEQFWGSYELHERNEDLRSQLEYGVTRHRDD